MSRRNAFSMSRLSAWLMSRLSAWLMSRRSVFSMSRLSAWLLWRLACATVVSLVLMGLSMWAGSGGSVAAGVGPVLWMMLGGALIAAPLAVFIALAWVAVSLSAGGAMEVLASTGIGRSQVASSMGKMALVLLVVAAVGQEVSVPHAREVISPMLSWEQRRREPVVFGEGAGGSRLAVRFGASLSRLDAVWVWSSGDLPQRFDNLRFTGGHWLVAGRPIVGIPSPDELLAQRPYLFELLSVRELWRLADSSSRAAYLAIAERLFRPWFFATWFACLAMFLLMRRWQVVWAAMLCVGWLAAGAGLMVVARELATAKLPLFVRIFWLGFPSVSSTVVVLWIGKRLDKSVSFLPWRE